MQLNMRSVAQAVCTATGAVIAGASGALIGNFTGGLLAAVIPGGAGFIGAIAAKMTSKAIEAASNSAASKLTPSEKQRINHDLQTALRDSLGEAITDIGGQVCFPAGWKSKRRDVPPALVFPLIPHVHKLFLDNDPRAGQVRAFFESLHTALAEQKILPLDPPSDQPAASVYSYLQAEDPQALNDAFFEQVIAPFMNGFGPLRAELPDLEPHLRRYLLDRTLVHLGEALKHRAPAWRAFNRLMLESMRAQLQSVGESQAEIIQRLDILLTQTQAEALGELSDGIADLLASFGRIEKQVDEGFDTLLARVTDQHGEVLARFDAVITVNLRIEAKVERVLRMLEDGRYVIEGAPPLDVDEPPAPGEPPFLGLQPFTENDAGLFFGRELLTARLVKRVAELLALPAHGADGATPKALLAVIGASGSGKSSLVRAGLLAALRRGEPLLDGTLPPAGSAGWAVHVLTPTARPLQALAASLTRYTESVTAAAALADDLAQDPRSLSLFVLRMSQPTPPSPLPEREGGEAPPSLEGKGAGGDRFLLVIDQFEELFTLCKNETERRAFIENLLHAAQPGSPLIIILTLRADFYAHCAQFDELRQAIAARQEYIGPMSRDDLLRAIEEPARRGPDGLRWQFEDGLAALIVNEIGAEPGALPLLSHALLETWKHRRGQTMTLESYAEAGGVRGAIAKTAETVYWQGLRAEQRPIARGIFLRLTEPGEGTSAGLLSPDTRRRAALSELTPRPEDAPAVEAVLQTLTDARLVVASEGVVEVAHEALIREWPTLRQWLDEDRQDIRLHRQLSDAAQDWSKLGQDTGAVYRGARLKWAVEWAEEHDDQLNDLERGFVAESRLIAEREAQAKEAQRQREIEAAQKLATEAEARRRAEETRAAEAERAAQTLRARNRVITIIGALAGVAALLALLFGVAAGIFGARSRLSEQAADRNLQTAQAASTQAIAQRATAQAASSAAQAEEQTRATAEASALQQKSTAEAASAEAQRQSRISLSRELAARAVSLLSRNRDLSLLLSIEAVRLSETLGGAVPDAQTALFQALNAASYNKVLRGHTGQVYFAVFSPDGSKIATTSDDGAARLWDVASGAPLAVLTDHDGQVFTAIFSPDSRLLVTTSEDNTARLWDAASGAPLAVLEGHTLPVLWATFSPNGRLIVTASMDNSARLWDVTGDGGVTLRAILEGHTATVNWAAFSPDSRRLVTTSPDATARLWDTDGNELAVLEGHNAIVNGASFSPDGSKIVSAGFDAARIWDLEGNQLAVLEGHRGAVYSAMFSPDGKWILTAGDDSTARLWTVAGEAAATLEGHAAPISLAVFSPDGEYILSASQDHTARLWRVNGGSPALVAALEGHTASLFTALFSPDGEWIVTAGSDNVARLWRVADLHPAAVQQAHGGPLTWATFSPDGSLVATGGLDNLARLWRADGTPLTTFSGHLGGVTCVNFSPDGTRLLTASRDKTARLWSLDGRALVTFTGHTDIVRWASFSPDGQRVITSGQDNTARLWSLDGRELATLEGHGGVVWSAVFSPDGLLIATASDDGYVGIWSADGTLLRALEDGSSLLNFASFSPDSQQVIVARADGLATLWAVEGEKLATFSGHGEDLTTAVFSPDGKLVLTASWDGTARLWLLDGAFLAALEGHTNWVSSALFSPDGRRVVTASWDGSFRLWDVFGDVAAMLAEAERRVDRALTAEECAAYLHVEGCGQP